MFNDDHMTCLGFRVYLAHITLGRKKDALYIGIGNPMPQNV